MEIIGLPLAVALEILPGTSVIIETAPPFVSQTRIPVWGEARVLRVLERDGTLELLVARELLGESKAPSP